MKHEAGKELDALVARHVMGLVWDETRCRVCGWPIKEDLAQGCTADSCSLRPAPQYRADEPAPFSTDIAAAWRIVEAISNNREMGYCLRGMYGGDLMMWGCQVVFTEAIGGNLVYHETWASTAPLAICLAALEAVGVEL